MQLKLSSKLVLVFALILSISACGRGIPVLPDDPESEPISSVIGDSPQNEQEVVGSEPTPSEPVPTEPLPVPPVQEPIAENPPVQDPIQEPAPPLSERDKILEQYQYVDPDHMVPTEHLETAILYYHEIKSTLRKPEVLSVIDYGKRSTEKRWFIINMTTGSVFSIHVAHGKGSDSNHDGYAEKFSNTEGSNATSLGFYKTAETYNGNNGYSLRLDGLSTTNSNARSRAIVIHGASYVQDSAVIQGRSWGCPAVSSNNRDRIINLIKGGSLIYAAE